MPLLFKWISVIISSNTLFSCSRFEGGVIPPTVITASTQSQDFTHLFNWEHGMMLLDKLVPFQSFLEKMPTGNTGHAEHVKPV